TATFIQCLVPYYPLIFRSERHRVRRDLHSFPTRRSSDLADASSAGMVDAGFENQKELTKMQLDNQKEIAEMQNETQKEIAGNLFLRSEERFSRNAETDLVCRLLLEKKK